MDINIDYDNAIAIDEATLDWIEDSEYKISKKIFSKEEDKETALIKIDENSDFSSSDKINSIEIFVLAGVYSNEFGDFEAGTYLKFPNEDQSKIKNSPCEIFRKINYNQIRDEEVMIDTKKEPWLPGQGNLEVMPLSESTALVYWPKNERFIEHSHWGGEEIFVLKGVFMDEHGEFKMGTWIRNPHLSKHYPYVEEESIILVKTGHM